MKSSDAQTSILALIAKHKKALNRLESANIPAMQLRAEIFRKKADQIDVEIEKLLNPFGETQNGNLPLGALNPTRMICQNTSFGAKRGRPSVQRQFPSGDFTRLSLAQTWGVSYQSAANAVRKALAEGLITAKLSVVYTAKEQGRPKGVYSLA